MSVVSACNSWVGRVGSSAEPEVLVVSLNTGSESGITPPADAYTSIAAPESGVPDPSDARSRIVLGTW